MAKVKTEYGRGILKGIDMVQEAFTNFTIKNPDKMNGTVTVAELIGFIAAYRAGVEQAVETAETEWEAKGKGENHDSKTAGF